MRESDGRLPRVLMIGPLPPSVPTESNPVGGASVNFAETVRQLKRRGFELDVVNLTRPRINLGHWQFWSNNMTTVGRVLWSLCARVRQCDLVMLNIGRAWPLAACIWVLCRIWRRPLVLRLFGGSFRDAYDAHGWLVRWCADRTYIRSSLVFVQTQEIVGRFGDRPNFRWFPNTRDLCGPRVECRRKARRFLFVSQLRVEKGLCETLEACRNISDDCYLTVYGPRMPDTDFSLFDGHPKAVYGGTLRPSDVARVITDHDVVLLPSYFDSEGHPGIILEAFQCGRPVISTWWKSIPEVVEHGVSGLLVQPRSVEALEQAIELLVNDAELYQRLCNGAAVRGEFFRSGRWYGLISDELCGVRDPAR